VDERRGRRRIIQQSRSRLVVSFAPGAPADVIGRIIGQQLDIILARASWSRTVAAPAAPSGRG
jgi:hypothetical protein